MDRVFFATNRNLLSDSPVSFGPFFNPDRPFFFRVGHAEVARRKRPRDPWDDAYAVDARRVALYPEKPPETPGASELLGSSAAFADIRDILSKDAREVILFIHGFANGFEMTLKRAAELRDQWLVTPREGGAALPPVVIAFAWPTDDVTLGAGAAPRGDVPKWAYFSDRDDAAASAKAIARAFLRLIDQIRALNVADRCDRRIHVVAHSMGTFALRHALQQLRRDLDGQRLPRLVENLFLMASDEDADALEAADKLSVGLELARQVHVYHAANDLALTVSDVTKFNPDRLGAHGPVALSHSIGRVFAVDCSEVSETALAHGRHQYYRLVPEVLRDVRAVLAGAPADLIPGRAVIEPGRRFRLPRDAALRKKGKYPPATVET